MVAIKMYCWIIIIMLLVSCQKSTTNGRIPLYTLKLFVDDVASTEIRHQKVPMQLLQTVDNYEVLLQKGTIERRGGSSIIYPKYSYEIDLEQDVPLANLPMDDDWILNANYIDKTFLRHAFSYELFRKMRRENIASQCQYVELELNGTYRGLYVLMEKVDKSTLKVNKEDPEAVIFKEPKVFYESYEGLEKYMQGNAHQQIYPKYPATNKTPLIDHIRALILDSKDDMFTAEIRKTFDIENIIDWHLLLLLSNNSDGLRKNFYLYKQNKATPLRIAIWDCDHGWGRDGDNELNLDRPLDLNRSILFRRLLTFNWYKKRLKARWDALNKSGLLSEEQLTKSIAEKGHMLKLLVEKNATVWPVSASFYHDANNFEQEIDVMLQYIGIRHKELRNYFATLI